MKSIIFLFCLNFHNLIYGYKYNQEFACSSISAEISQKTNNYINTNETIDNYKLLKKEIANDVDFYEKWLSQDIKTGKYVHIKVESLNRKLQFFKIFSFTLKPIKKIYGVIRILIQFLTLNAPN